MTDAPNNEAIGTPAIQWYRGNDFKSEYSNFIRTRLGPNEISIIFSRLGDGPGGTPIGMALAEELIEITTNWTHLKMWTTQLAGIVQGIEDATGPIPLPGGWRPTGVQSGAMVRTFNLTTEPTPPDGIDQADEEPG